jgi:heat shock protein HslJ
MSNSKNLKCRSGIAIMATVLCLSLLGGCAMPAAQRTAPSASASAAGLTATRWQLISWSGHEIPNGVNGEPVILSFTDGDEASVSGRAWCNRFNAPYVLRDAQRLTIGHAAATRMACMGKAMEFESAFLDKLQALDHFRIRDNTLELQAVDGELMILLARDK